MKRCIMDWALTMRRDFGKPAAVQATRELKTSLETIIECGDTKERLQAVKLLTRVEAALTVLLHMEG
jgi:hypothetical protein